MRHWELALVRGAVALFLLGRWEFADAFRTAYTIKARISVRPTQIRSQAANPLDKDGRI